MLKAIHSLCFISVPSASNTAPILNIFEILANMSFIDDDSCHDDEDQNKE